MATGGRLKGVVMVKPIIYGNISICLPEKRSDGRTHEWTVFVRPYENEDMSIYVKKVHFKLHDSYGNCNRVVTEPPYQVVETGWGEFEIVIKIYFQDPNERPATLYHVLKLFHPGEESLPKSMTDKPVISENYEEVVFQDPTTLMHSLLTSSQQGANAMPKVHQTDFEEKKKITLQKLQSAKQQVSNEIKDYKMKLKIAQETLSNFKEAVIKSRKSSENFMTGKKLSL